MTSEEIIAMSDQFVMGTYRRCPVALIRGKGCRVWDADAKEYLDFLAGIAVCALGHCHPQVVAAIRKQAGLLGHVSNIFYIEQQAQLAKLLVENSFADRVFFCNSGAEANEGAMKLARKYAHEHMGANKYELITMENSFHGRTLATVTATGQRKFQAGFEPLPEGFCYVPFDDLYALESAIGEKTCGVLLEPIQAEGGIRIPAEGYLKGVREICDRKGVLMMLDEVQTGMGRTGTLFAHETSGICPDIATLAKALGNGFPVGAMLATEKVASVLVPGTHASTFGGNPLAMAASMASTDLILNGGVLENCRKMGAYFLGRLERLKKKYSFVTDARGRGLILGLELSMDGAEIVSECMKKGLLINCTSGNVLRFVPPLTVRKGEIDRAVKILDSVLGGGI